MSATHSNSRSSTAARSAAREGKTSSSYTYSKATLYSTAMLWNEADITYKDSFLSAIQGLDNTTNNTQEAVAKGILFFQQFGTHALNLARMGARCRETTYFTSSTSSESQSLASESSSASSGSYSGSVSASYSGWGFSGLYTYCVEIAM